MSVQVNPPPQLRIPDRFSQTNDPEAFAYFRQVQTILFQLWNRTGGSNDGVDSVASEVADIDSLFAVIGQIDSLRFRNVVSTSSDYATGGSEIVLCNAKLTVTLNATPDDQELVTIKRNSQAVTVDGNGKAIDGSSIIIINRKYTSLDMIYTAETDSWSIK